MSTISYRNWSQRQLVGPVLRTLPRSHGLVHGIQDTDETVNVFTSLVRSGRLGDMPQCARVVPSSARATQTAAAIFILTAVPEADVAFQCLASHLKNSNFPLRHRPINQPPRLLPWRIQEAPVRTRSNAARFSAAHTPLKKL